MLCNSVDCNPPASSDRGLFQAIILEWAASIGAGCCWPTAPQHSAQKPMHEAPSQPGLHFPMGSGRPRKGRMRPRRQADDSGLRNTTWQSLCWPASSCRLWPSRAQRGLRAPGQGSCRVGRRELDSHGPGGTGGDWPGGDGQGLSGFGEAQAFQASRDVFTRTVGAPVTGDAEGSVAPWSSCPAPPSQPLASQAGERQEAERHVTGSKWPVLLGE